MHLEQLRTKIINTSVMRKGVCDMIPENASSILEVGCGQGGILVRLQRDKGCTDLYGIDMDVAAIQALQNFIEYAEVRDIEKQEIMPEKYLGYFKYIILHDVIEHLFDPWHTMTRIRPFLADDGVAIIATPNLQYWRLQYEILSGRFPYGPGLWHTGHLRWYTPSSLLTVLCIGGFNVDEYYIELDSDVDKKWFTNSRPLTSVQFPPMELQANSPDMPVITAKYEKDIRPNYHLFFGPKLIAVCSKGDLFWEPQPLTYSCPYLKQLTQMVGNPYDIYNPPPTRPYQPLNFALEEIK